MKIRSSYTALVVALGIGLVGVANAQQSRSTFKDFDANGDGRISKEEFQSERGAKYQQAYQEGRRVAPAAKSMAAFADIDTDGDGFISPQEFGGQRAGVAGDRRERRAERRQQQGAE